MHSLEALSIDTLGEWISGSVCQYFAKQLVHSYKKSKKVNLIVTSPIATCNRYFRGKTIFIAISNHSGHR